MYKAQASVNVSASPQTAWNYVSNYQNFDKIMSNVKEVKILDQDLSEWHMAGPLGIPVSWKAVTTENTPPRRLAWKSTEGSLENQGYITVEPEANGSRITVNVEYTPPLGAVGEAVANLFKDPQAMLEHDLSQLDGLISNGIAPAKMSDTDSGMGMGRATSGMDNFDRTAERGEKVSGMNDVTSPGGMTGYGVTDRAGRGDLDPEMHDLDSDDSDMVQKTR
jgi:carbon monoxide dehydrogenase subunit G